MPDISILNNSGQVELLRASFADEDQTLIQRVTLLIRAAYVRETDQGTYFSQRLEQGSAMTDAGIRSEFALAAAMVLRTLGDQTDLPLSQQVRRIQLNSYTREGGQLALSLSLVTADNVTKMMPSITVS